MMNFRTIKDALIDVLGDNAAGQFQVIGFQRQATDASETLDMSRTVQVYFKSGDFPKSQGRTHGSTQHDMTFHVDMMVSKASEYNLAAINDDSATSMEMMSALAGLQEASALADISMDELMDIVYQILMAANNYDFGLSKGLISNRWITQMTKDSPLPKGEYVILTGQMIFTCRASEAITGEILETVGGYYSNSLIIDQDENQQTMIDIDNSIIVDDGGNDETPAPEI
jgi:hypothetical protein